MGLPFRNTPWTANRKISKHFASTIASTQDWNGCPRKLCTGKVWDLHCMQRIVQQLLSLRHRSRHEDVSLFLTTGAWLSPSLCLIFRNKHMNATRSCFLAKKISTCFIGCIGTCAILQCKNKAKAETGTQHCFYIGNEKCMKLFRENTAWMQKVPDSLSALSTFLVLNTYTGVLIFYHPIVSSFVSTLCFPSNVNTIYTHLK